MSKTWILLTGVSAAVVMAASAASATDLSSVYFAAVDEAQNTNIGGEDAIATPLIVTGGPKTLYVFCVDLTHNISVPSGPYDYKEIPMTEDTYGTPGDMKLSDTTVEEIGRLANIGAGLIKDNASNLDNQLAGIQDAIWDIEYAETGYTITPDDPTDIDPLVTADIAYAEAHPLASTKGVEAIVPVDGDSTQGFLIGAPEPASWALMTIGVGAIGAMLRRRRQERTAPTRGMAGSAQIIG